MSEQPDADSANQGGFEDAMSRLEAIVHALEEGQIPLADALARYEEGIKLLKECYRTLARAERRIELLSDVDSEGRAQSESFDDSELSMEQKAGSRAQRRSRKVDSPAASPQNEIDESGRLF